MRLWTSGEIQADVFDAYRLAINVIEAEINRILRGMSLSEKVEEWAFLAIIRHEDSPDFDEIVRKSARKKTLEFRLKISHRDFASASRRGQIRLILAALERSVGLMDNLGVSRDTQDALLRVLSQVEQELVQKRPDTEVRSQ